MNEDLNFLYQSEIQDGHNNRTQFNIEPYWKYIQTAFSQKMFHTFKPNQAEL